MKSIKVCEYSRSRSFHDDLMLQDQASGERSQDHWSSVFLLHVFAIKHCVYLIFFPYKIKMVLGVVPSKSVYWHPGKGGLSLWCMFILPASLMRSLPLVLVETSWMATLLGKS